MKWKSKLTSNSSNALTNIRAAMPNQGTFWTSGASSFNVSSDDFTKFLATSALSVSFKWAAIDIDMWSRNEGSKEEKRG